MKSGGGESYDHAQVVESALNCESIDKHINIATVGGRVVVMIVFRFRYCCLLFHAGRAVLCRGTVWLDRTTERNEMQAFGIRPWMVFSPTRREGKAPRTLLIEKTDPSLVCGLVPVPAPAAENCLLYGLHPRGCRVGRGRAVAHFVRLGDSFPFGRFRRKF